MLIDELRRLNLIIFPDWSGSEDAIVNDLEAILSVLFSHPAKQDITLLIDTQMLADELQDSANLLLFQIILKLSLEESVAVADELHVGLTGALSADEWQMARSLLTARIAISTENLQAIEQLQADQLPVWSLLAISQESVYEPARLESLLQWGDYFLGNGSIEQSIPYYQTYLSQRPQRADIYLKLSEIYQQRGQLSAAIQILQSGIQHCPQGRELYFWLIVRCNDDRAYLTARTVAQQAANQFPDDYTFKILSHLLLPQSYNTPDEIDTYRAWFTQGLERLIQETALNTPQERQNALSGISHVTNFFLAYQERNDVDLQRQYGALVRRIMAANYPQWVQPRLPLWGTAKQLQPSIDLPQRIRIGYLSSFLCGWSGTVLFLNWLKYADPQQFEIYAYHIGDRVDAATQRFQTYSTRFYHLPTSLETIVQQVLNDRLHALIFPELGMDAKTLCIAGLRLAPIQCMAWGHPVTSGLPTIDYFLSSELMEPANGQDHYSEQLVRLPGVGISYPAISVPQLQRDRAFFGLRDDAVVYLSSQAPYKYLPQYDYLYAEIARQVPTAQLMFLRGGIPAERLERAFAAVGLDSRDYCVVSPVLPRDDYFNLLSLCDIYLDTPGWAGGNTTLDAIAAQLPIVTCAGALMRGRHSYGFLKAMDVTATIAEGEAEYIAIAVRLAQEADWRRSIRDALQQSASVLFDNPTRTRDLEAFLRQAVEALRPGLREI